MSNSAILDFGSARLKLNILINESFEEKYLNFKDETHLSSFVNKDNVLDEEYFINVFIPKVIDFVKIIKEHNVDNMISVGTHIFRNLKNAETILKELNKHIGHLNVISGDLEGKLFYKSVEKSTKNNDFILMDVGGGSTQIIFKDKSYSFSTGTFTLEKEFQASKDMATNDELKKMYIHIKDNFKKINEDSVSSNLIFGSSCMKDFAISAFANSKIKNVENADCFIDMSKYE